MRMSRTISLIAGACAILLLAQPAFAKTVAKPKAKATSYAVNHNAKIPYKVYTTAYKLAGEIKGQVGPFLLVSTDAGETYTVDIAKAKLLDDQNHGLKRAALKVGIRVQVAGRLAKNSTGMDATAVKVVPIPTTTP